MIKYNNYFNYFIFLFLIYIHIDIIDGQTLWTLNNHYYEFIALSGLNYSMALQTINNRTFNGLKGYMATITSIEESNFVFSPAVSGYVSGRSYIIGGNRVGSPDLFYWNGGPEAGMPIFQYSSGRCFEYCNWDTSPPTPSSGDVIQVTVKYYTAVNIGSSGTYYYLVEYGGLTDPYFPASNTLGGELVIPNMNQGTPAWNLENVTISMTISQSPPTTINIPILNRSSTNFIVDFPDGQFTQSSLLVQDGVRSFTYPNYKSLIPFIRYIVPGSMTAGSRVTIVGENFGSETGAISISDSLSASCSGIQFIQPHRIISCVLPNTYTNSFHFYPIKLSVGTQILPPNDKIPFYEPTSVSVSKLSQVSYTWDNIRKGIIDARQGGYTVDFNPPYHGLFTTPGQESIAKIVYSWRISSDIFVSLRMNSQFQIVINNTGGPHDGEIAVSASGVFNSSLVWKSGTYVAPTMAEGRTYGYDPSSRSLVDSTGLLRGEFTMYGDRPYELIGQPQLLEANTTGGEVYYNVGGSSGFEISSRSFRIDSVGVAGDIRQTSATQLGIIVPEGSGTNHTFDVSIEMYRLGNAILSYRAPFISSVISPPTNGGGVTFFGYNFGKKASNIIATFNGVPCSPVTMIQTHYTASCIVPKGVGIDKLLNITLAGQTGTFNVSYQSPTIQFTSVNMNSTLVTIAGTNFGNGFADIYTVPSSSQVSFIQPNPQVNYISYIVDFPPTTRNGNISVHVGGQISNFVYYKFTPVITQSSSIPLTGGDLTLRGYFFNTLRQNGENTTIELKVVDGATIFYPTFVSTNSNNDTFIFNAPPGIGGNMLAYLTIDGMTSYPCIVGYEGPILSSIIQNGTILTITGSNFGSQLNIVTVSIRGISDPIVPTSMTNGIITIDIPPTTTNSYLKVIVSDQSTPEYPFTLQPIVTDVSTVPTYGGIFTIDGFFFNSVDILGNALSFNITNGDGNQLCDNAYIVNSGTDNRQVVCQIGEGTGTNKSAILSIGSNSTLFSYSYNSPIITNIQQIQTTLSIQGTDFGNDPSKILVNIGSNTTAQTVTFDSQTNLYTIVTTIPDDSTNGGVSIRVDGVDSNNDQYLSLKPLLLNVSAPSVLGGKLIIQGKYLSLKRRDNSSAPVQIYIDNSSNLCTQINNTGVGILECMSPEGYGLNHNLFVSIDSILSDSITMNYQVPLVNELIQIGSLATLIGSSFGSNPSQIQVFFGSQLNNYAISTSISQDGRETFNVSIPKYSQSGLLTVVVAGISSNSFYYQLTPQLNNVTTPGTDGGPITISGDYFSNTTNNGTQTVIQVTIGGKPCDNVQSLPVNPQGFEEITCIAPAGAGSDLTLLMNIDGKVGSILFSYDGPSITSVNVSPVNNEIIITGKNWGSKLEEDIKLFYGTTQIDKQEFNFDSVLNTITFTPSLDSLNDYVYIENLEGTQSNSLYVLLYPIISSVTSAQTSGSNVTLTGTFLNTVNALGTPTNFTVLFNGTPIQVIDDANTNSTFKLITVPKGTGSHSNITVSVQGCTDTLLNYTYQAPTINGLVQDGSTLHIIGNNFGDDSSLVTLIQENPVQLSINSINDTVIVTSLPLNYLNSKLQVVVDSLQSNESYISVKPIITSVGSVSPWGGQINITGQHLNGIRANGSNTNIVISAGSSSSNNCQLLVYGDNGDYLICKLGASSFNQASMMVSIDGANSNQLNYTSLPPKVTDITSTVYNVSSTVTITGQHFYSPSLVTIGSTPCNNAFVGGQGTTITCTFSSLEPPSTIGIPVIVNSVGLASQPASIFFYSANLCGGVTPVCNGRGTCVNGRCQCVSGYSGDTCSIAVNPTPLMPSLSLTSPNATFNLGRGVEIETGIVYVREIGGVSGATVSVADLRTSSWTALPSINTTSSISTTFTTTLNNSAILSVTVTVFNTTSTTQFAGETITQTARSFKHLVTVKNWNFTSTNNRVEVIYRAVTPTTFDFNCTTASTKIYTNSSNIGALNNTLTSFLIDSPIGVVQSKFTSRSIIDLQVQAMRTYQLSSSDPLTKFSSNQQGLYVAMTLSSFSHNATFDPSFYGYLKQDPTPPTCGTTTTTTTTTTSTTTGGQSTTTGTPTTHGGGHTTKGSTTRGTTTSSSTNQFNNISQFIIILSIILNLLFI